ncbi:MAG: SEL1-like repeat protein [Oscillibacter sp.]|nr:SEL1-like repeat protein [Oscillibacter sp.]
MEAQYNAGVMYMYGDGVEVDLVKAKAWLEKSAAQGYSDAAGALETLLDDLEGLSGGG